MICCNARRKFSNDRIGGSGSGRVMNFRSRSGGRAAPVLTVHGLVRSVAGLRTSLVLLLLALLVQGTVVQTHLHFAQQALSLATAPSDRQPHASTPDTTGRPAHCPLCKEAAMAGAYVLPPPVILPPPPAPVRWIAVAAMAEFGLLAPAHAWQSRAPPQ
jgi:hypothetical protein